MIELRSAEDRGKANFGWLKSQHSFSFGSYYDAKNMGFSKLRVINEDLVSPEAGFGTHGHRDMEIISFVTHGEIEHKDSMGNIQRLPRGEFQLMSAGSVVQHSEYNSSKKDSLAFLQIWIEPNVFGKPPSYQQKDFGREKGLTPIITPDGQNGTLQIKQDAYMSQLVLSPGQSLDLPIETGRKYYLHIVEGALWVNKQFSRAGDGLKIENISGLDFVSDRDSQTIALLFNLPA